MVTSTTLRAASARGSRAGSTARDILKRREKPYKTEQEKVFVQKRKLNLEVRIASLAVNGQEHLRESRKRLEHPGLRTAPVFPILVWRCSWPSLNEILY